MLSRRSSFLRVNVLLLFPLMPPLLLRLLPGPSAPDLRRKHRG
jgi:hypothetical protein